VAPPTRNRPLEMTVAASSAPAADWALVPVTDPAAATRALALVDSLGDERGEAVDASEVRRLRHLVREGRTADGWEASLLVDHGDALGYAGLRDLDTLRWTGEAAAQHVAVLVRLLGHLERRARAAGAGLEVWVRDADEPTLRVIGAQTGLVAARRLAVLTHDLHEPVRAPDAGGVEVRAARHSDLDQVVAVLDAAYRDTAEGPWTRERLDAEMAEEWFHLGDLLVAETPDGALVGVHWTKRRSARIGEVHNLAVDPAAHGRGVGASLLAAGLAHLRDVGADEVVLWVDLGNVPAVGMYEARGFERVRLDVCLVPADQASSGPRDSR
jgi:mycothiol synthase